MACKLVVRRVGKRRTAPCPPSSSTSAKVGTLGTSGLYQGVLTLTADQKAALAAQLAYFNIHSAKNPGGEIRGQIVP